MPVVPGTRLGAYEILSPLGAGGMGEVYRARDTRLGRMVALKVLPEGFLESEEGKARFEREARTLASLNHPNVAVLHSFEEAGGRHILVMELLEGTTLRDKLDSGPVSPKQTVDYALQIAKGLSAAHEMGIVHRDLKPENLFVSKDGHLKILDFGLAKRTEQETTGEETSAPTESKHTEPGVVMGTVGYMSPEQVRGLPVDHRSDIFSFGAILYEMLSGKKAFKRDTPADTMSAIMRDDPPELSESGRDIPPALDQVVKHCLEKDRSDRFQSAKDVAFALSQASGPTTMTSGPSVKATAASRNAGVFVALAAIALVTFAGILLFRRSNRPPSDPVGPKRIAVLPFENLGAAEDGYFADGMTDEVRSKLAGLSGLSVIASTSSNQYKATTKPAEQIAKELGVGYLLVAKVRWQKSAQANRIRVSPELVDVRGEGSPTTRWQEAFDADLSDVFKVQGEIAAKVAKSLDLVLSGKEHGSLVSRPTSNLAAWDAYLRGEEAKKTNDAPGWRKALDSYEQAVALDPAFAQAWARIATASGELREQSNSKAALADRISQAAEKAVALAPDRPDGYLALGNYKQFFLHDRARAMEEYAKAQQVAPGNPDVAATIGWAEFRVGRWDSAVEHFKMAERLDPRSVTGPFTLGLALIRLRRYPEARQALDRAVILEPKNLFLIGSRAETFLGVGDLAGARAALRAAPREIPPTALVANVANIDDLVWVLDEEQRELLVRLTPSAYDENRGVWGICLAQAYALKGDSTNVRTYAEEARKDFEEGLRTAPDDLQGHAFLGLSLAYLGRKEEAIREGELIAADRRLADDAWGGPYLKHQLARIYILVGEQEKALDQLEPLLKIPYLLSPGWLRIDPNFDPLRKNPRFQKLVAGK